MAKKIELAISSALELLKKEEDSRNALDTKASILLGFLGTILGLVVGFVFQTPHSLANAAVPGIILFLSSILLLVLTVLFLLLSLRIRDYRTGPGEKLFLRSLEILKRKEFVLKLTTSYLMAFSHNRHLNGRKVVLLNLAFILFALGFTGMAASMILIIFSGGQV